jgi:hypothetical protein
MELVVGLHRGAFALWFDGAKTPRSPRTIVIEAIAHDAAKSLELLPPNSSPSWQKSACRAGAA